MTFVEPRIGSSNKLLVSNWRSEVEGINLITKENIELSEADLAKIKTDRNNKSRLKNILNSSQNAKNELQKSKNLFKY